MQLRKKYGYGELTSMGPTRSTGLRGLIDFVPMHPLDDRGLLGPTPGSVELVELSPPYL